MAQNDLQVPRCEGCSACMIEKSRVPLSQVHAHNSESDASGTRQTTLNMNAGWFITYECRHCGTTATRETGGRITAKSFHSGDYRQTAEEAAAERAELEQERLKEAAYNAAVQKKATADALQNVEFAEIVGGVPVITELSKVDQAPQLPGYRFTLKKCIAKGEHRDPLNRVSGNGSCELCGYRHGSPKS